MSSYLLAFLLLEMLLLTHELLSLPFPFSLLEGLLLHLLSLNKKEENIVAVDCRKIFIFHSGGFSLLCASFFEFTVKSIT